MSVTDRQIQSSAESEESDPADCVSLAPAAAVDGSETGEVGDDGDGGEGVEHRGTAAGKTRAGSVNVAIQTSSSHSISSPSVVGLRHDGHGRHGRCLVAVCGCGQPLPESPVLSEWVESGWS